MEWGRMFPWRNNKKTIYSCTSAGDFGTYDKKIMSNRKRRECSPDDNLLKPPTPQPPPPPLLNSTTANETVPPVYGEVPDFALILLVSNWNFNLFSSWTGRTCDFVWFESLVCHKYLPLFSVSNTECLSTRILTRNALALLCTRRTHSLHDLIPCHLLKALNYHSPCLILPVIFLNPNRKNRVCDCIGYNNLHIMCTFETG